MGDTASLDSLEEDLRVHVCTVLSSHTFSLAWVKFFEIGLHLSVVCRIEGLWTFGLHPLDHLQNSLYNESNGKPGSKVTHKAEPPVGY